MKVTILSPVHIGTGNENMAFQYNQNGDVLNCYKLSDLLATVSADKLISNAFLNSIQIHEKASKQQLISIKKEFDYTKVKPQYQLTSYDDLVAEQVYEQVKSLNKPIIPGSSLKGALISCACYSFIKKHFDLLKPISLGKLKTEILLSKITGRDNSNILHDISTNIYCDDIAFNKLGLYKTVRATLSNDIPIGFQETIDIKQTRNGNFYRFEDTDRRLREYNKPLEKEFINTFKKENLCKAVNEFTSKTLSMDDSAGMQKYYDETDLLYLQKNIEKYIEKIKNIDDNKCIVRIGKDTNYNYKGSLALLFREKEPTYFKKNFDKFSPGRRLKIKADTVPSTRVFFEENFYYPGFMEIDFND